MGIETSVFKNYMKYILGPKLKANKVKCYKWLKLNCKAWMIINLHEFYAFLESEHSSQKKFYKEG